MFVSVELPPKFTKPLDDLQSEFSEAPGIRLTDPRKRISHSNFSERLTPSALARYNRSSSGQLTKAHSPTRGQSMRQSMCSIC